ncbi:hypothetical protein SFP17_027 [Shigella phage SFP17]|uniref:Uncharacterized protein n=1 Tax=Shigella phage SFP17 TaxID=2692510 RepID=A0AAE6RGM3_9CAUD|nr:hypothetical protein SFP17_027 [Shigella phage SFP17]
MCQWLCVSIYLYPAQMEEQENKKTTRIFINNLHVSFVIQVGENVVRTEKTK